MASASVPAVGTRVNVQVFASDLLAHQGLVQVTDYPSSGYVGARFDDGAGVTVVLSGDRSSVRMVLSAALDQLGPEVDDDTTTQAPRRPDTYLDGIDHDTGQGG
jgi:hypothetical protein